jgi:hypothetical protein
MDINFPATIGHHGATDDQLEESPDSKPSQGCW